jgi:DNA-binding MarR family transcriptional regulator
MATPRDPDLAECAACACFAIRRAARVITQHYDRTLRPSGLRATQFTLLTMLSLGGPVPLSRVADRLGMERTTLTRNLKPLLATGLISVRPGTDRRVRTIAITPKGHRAAVAALPDWRRAQRPVASQLTSGVFASLADVTQRLSSDRARGSVRKPPAKEMKT